MSNHSYGKAAWGTCNLGGAECLWISKVGQTVLARLMESQIWHQLAGSVALSGEDLEKGQWLLLTFMPYISVFSSIPLVPFKLLPGCWSSEGVSLNLSVGSLRGTAWGSRSFFQLNPTGVCSEKLWRLVFLALEPRTRGPVWVWDSLLLRYPS